jgi:hypothetical protein
MEIDNYMFNSRKKRRERDNMETWGKNDALTLELTPLKASLKLGVLYQIRYSFAYLITWTQPFNILYLLDGSRTSKVTSVM